MVISEETKKLMQTAKENMTSYIEIIDDILNGISVHEACERKGIAPQTLYRKISYMTNDEKTKRTVPYRERKKALNSFPVNLYKEVFIEYGNNVPEIPKDYEDRLNVLQKGLDDREMQVYTLYYVKSLPLRDVGEQIGKSYETIRTVKNEILKKLRKTYSIDVLLGKIPLDKII